MNLFKIGVIYDHSIDYSYIRHDSKTPQDFCKDCGEIVCKIKEAEGLQAKKDVLGIGNKGYMDDIDAGLAVLNILVNQYGYKHFDTMTIPRLTAAFIDENTINFAITEVEGQTETEHNEIFFGFDEQDDGIDIDEI